MKMTARTAQYILMAAGILLLSPSYAQQGDEIGPSVDTSDASAFENSDSRTNPIDDDFGPGVDTSDTTAFGDSDSDYESAGFDDQEDAESAATDGVVRTASGTSGVMDRLTLGRTEITGNQELPKVMYIVPWQKSDPGDLMGRPVNTLLDEVLAPLDREEFIRQVSYHSDLQGNSED